MDTDELSEETYKAILKTSEKFNHDLTLQFGLLADGCTDDNDFLEQANQLIIEWKSDLANSIDNIFVERPSASSFENALLKIQNQIEEVLRIPISKRKFRF